MLMDMLLYLKYFSSLVMNHHSPLYVPASYFMLPFAQNQVLSFAAVCMCTVPSSVIYAGIWTASCKIGPFILFFSWNCSDDFAIP